MYRRVNLQQGDKQVLIVSVPPHLLGPVHSSVPPQALGRLHPALVRLGSQSLMHIVPQELSDKKSPPLIVFSLSSPISVLKVLTFNSPSFNLFFMKMLVSCKEIKIVYFKHNYIASASVFTDNQYSWLLIIRFIVATVALLTFPWYFSTMAPSAMPWCKSWATNSHLLTKVALGVW